MGIINMITKHLFTSTLFSSNNKVFTSNLKEITEFHASIQARISNQQLASEAMGRFSDASKSKSSLVLTLLTLNLEGKNSNGELALRSSNYVLFKNPQEVDPARNPRTRLHD